MGTALVTVTYNGSDVWEDFYRSVLDQVDQEWELVVVDNASADGTVERLRAIDDPRVHVIFNDTNVGVAAANNQGIHHALARGAARVVLINNDTVLPVDLLPVLRACREETGADMVSPLIASHEEPERVWYGGGHYKKRGGVQNVHEHWMEHLSAVGSRPFVSEYAPTTCLMLDRSVFDRIGFMDERYFVYWDDVDFVWRARLAGLKLVVEPRTVLFHKGNHSTGGMSSDFSIRYMHRNQMLFTRKFHGPILVLYTSVSATLSGIKNVIRGRERPRHALLRARALGEGLRVAGRTATPTGEEGARCAS